MKTFDEARVELDAFMRNHAPPHYATPDAPCTYVGLVNWYERWSDSARWVGTPFCMPVSSEHCENTVYLTPEGNHAFRAWHDYGHLQFDCAFTYEDEMKLAVKHQRLVLNLGMSREARELLWIDSAKQSEYEHATGEFPENQLEFARFWFTRWRKRYVRS